jgi:uncharacterized protein (TIGR02001 family)
MKTLTGTILCMASLLALSGGSAWAADITATGGVSVQSDYRFRGISQNDRQPTPEATLNLFGPDGWYGGTWVAKTNWGVARPSGGTDNPSMEADFYLGKNTALFDGAANLNVEAYYYAYPDYNAGGGPKASFFEGIAQLSHSFGNTTAILTWAVSPEYSLGGGTSNYLAGGLSYVVNDWLSISGNVGHQWVEATSYDYTHGDIGATLTYRALSLDLRYVATDMGKMSCAFYSATRNACVGGFTGTLTYSITSWP